MLFLVYSNDLALGLKFNVKLFADDTSLFTVVEDPTIAAYNMNQNWRMPFTPEAIDLNFPRKRIENGHPHLFSDGIPVKKVNDHKHLGIILDSKLSFTPPH